MITKKKEKEKEKNDQEIGHASRKLFPPPYILHTNSTLPRFASGPNPSSTFSYLLVAMANPHNLPPGNPAFGRLSALNSPLPSRSGTPSTDHPIEFMMRQLAQARSVLRLNTQDFPDPSPDAQAGTLPIEFITIVLLSQLAQGLVTISHELSGLTQAVATISEENDNLREELHDVSSQLAILPHSPEHQTTPGIADLQASIRDLSHRVSAPAPAPLSQTPHPQRNLAPPPTAGPPPSTKGKERARAPPTPPSAAADDPKYLIPFYDTRLGKAFGDPEKYARLYPNSYEAGEFRKGRYDLDSFTPGHLHPDVHPSPSCAQAASGSGSGGKGKRKAGKPPSPQLVASTTTPPVKKGPPSLPGAQRRFFAPRQSPSPHPDALTIAATFPDIAARVLRESNCLLPLGFSATVNPRGSVSLTVTEKATPATSYAPYFNSLTRALNQSFPVGENPWCTLVLAPTAVQLAIHGLPLRFLPQDEEELFPYLRQAILKDKATSILSARYLNPSRDSREAKPATSVAITVDLHNVSALTSGVVILSQKRKVELAFSSSKSAQCKNCWRYGHAHQRCPATHPRCPICALHHTRAAHRCQNPTCPRSGNNKPVPSYCPTSPPHCCNSSADHTATFRECQARPPPPVPTRTNSPAPAPTGQDPMDLAVNGGPTSTTPPCGTAPLEVDLVTPRQPPQAGPSTRPGTIHGFGGPLPLEEPSPTPAPRDRRVRPGNE